MAVGLDEVAGLGLVARIIAGTETLGVSYGGYRTCGRFTLDLAGATAAALGRGVGLGGDGLVAGLGCDGHRDLGLGRCGCRSGGGCRVRG